MSAYPVPPPDGATRWAKYRLRFERRADGRLPEGSSEKMAGLMTQPAMIARVQASMDGLHAVEADTRAVLCTAGRPSRPGPGPSWPAGSSARPSSRNCLRAGC
ncbi:MAG: hypothetical protein R6X14_10105, partial [bacterium]